MKLIAKKYIFITRFRIYDDCLSSAGKTTFLIFLNNYFLAFFSLMTCLQRHPLVSAAYLLVGVRDVCLYFVMIRECDSSFPSPYIGKLIL